MKTLITLTGPTCSGKSTLEKMMVEADIPKLVSFTTRKMRMGEEEGKDYYFWSETHALDMIQKGEAAEWNKFGSNYYGLTNQEIQKGLSKGLAVVVVDPNGLTTLKKYRTHVNNSFGLYSVFISNPLPILAARFLDRYKGDKIGVASNYATRLLTLVDEEQKWKLLEAYDKAFYSFNQDNDTEIMNQIINAAKAIIV